MNKWFQYEDVVSIPIIYMFYEILKYFYLEQGILTLQLHRYTLIILNLNFYINMNNEIIIVCHKRIHFLVLNKNKIKYY